MADAKLSALTELASGAVDADADWIYIDDVSVTTSKKTLGSSIAVSVAASQAQVDAGTVANRLITPALRKISLLATQATTAGTSWDFTIPAGAREIKVHFVGHSTNGTSNNLIQIGDAGGIETTGYVSIANHDSTQATSTSGFIVTSFITNIRDGHITLGLVDAATFTWTSGGTLCDAQLQASAGRKSLTAELTTVRVTTVNGTDAGDAGLVGCSYIL